MRPDLPGPGLLPLAHSSSWPLLETRSKGIVTEVTSETLSMTWAFGVELVWPWSLLLAFTCDSLWVVQIQSQGQWWSGRGREEEGRARVLLSQLGDIHFFLEFSCVLSLDTSL